MTRSDASQSCGEGSLAQADVLDILGPPRPDDAHKPAVIFHDREITYAAVHAEVSCLASGLRSRLRPGDLLAIWLPNCPELLCLYLACLKTGIAPMPLHQGMKWPEMRETLQRTGVKWLITSRKLADPHAAELAGMHLDRITVIEQDSAPYHSYFDLLVHDEGAVNDGMDGQRERTIHPLALVLHTSGSHGHAKGVMLSRANIDHILQYRRTHTHLTPDSVSVVASCLTQSVGFYQSLALLATGGTIVLLESYDIGPMVDGIHRHQPTHLIMVVEAFDRLLHHPAITAESFRRLTFASVGADRVTSRVQSRFMALTGRPLRVSYGLTESSWALVNPGEAADKCLSLGQPCPGIEIRLTDREGQVVPTGEIGEIWIKSPRTMSGYLHDEEQTRAAFVDGWLLSGDLASRDADGWYWFAGRKKHLIVLSSGDNVSPLEVENVILGHPLVSNCTVVGIATAEGSEVPWAAVIRRDEMLSEAHLEEFLRARISDYKIPQRIVFLSELPIGRSGKVHREEARKILLQTA